jgi:hypothetical protein
LRGRYGQQQQQLPAALLVVELDGARLAAFLEGCFPSLCVYMLGAAGEEDKELQQLQQQQQQ